MKSVNGFHKHTAALAAAAVILNGIGSGLPAMKLLPAGSVRSAAEFSEMLAAAYEPPAEQFGELRYDPETDQLYRDGTPVGKSYGGFTVSEGTLTAESSSEAGGELPADEAVRAMGCEILEEEDGSLTVRSPFQSARLIVRSARSVNPMGGTITAEGYRDLHVIQYDSPEEAYQAYLAFRQDSGVTLAQPDRIRRTEPAPVSEETAGARAQEDELSWGYHAIGSAEYLAWLDEHHPDLPEITVAVLDSGIYAEHNWFRGRISENGIDCTDTSPYSLSDAIGHGTHCAGIICQNTPDSVKILPVKVIADDGYGSDMMIYCGIMYAVEQNADVISMSLGGDGDSPLMLEAIRTAAEADIPCCVAAGNSEYNADYSSPGCYDFTICISALDLLNISIGETDYLDPRNYMLAPYSNFGAAIDIAAPGTEIISAYIGDPDALAVLSGTSMAAPFVSAACADLLSADPKLKTDKIRSMIRQHAIPLNVTPNHKQTAAECFGSGMLNLRGMFFSEVFVPEPEIKVVSKADNYGISYYAKDSIEVELTSSDTKASVYYTLDGSEPDQENGTLYTAPVTLRKSAVMRAAAFKDNDRSRSTAAYFCINSQEIDDPYTVENGVLTSYHGVMQDLDLSTAFPDGSLKAIGSNAFAGTPVRFVVLPDSVQSVGNRAFYSTPLSRITAKGLTEVGDYAFAKTELLEYESAPLKKLGTGAFQDCFLLTASPILDASLTEIPDLAFAGCGDMKALNFDPTKLTKIGKESFSSLGYEGAMQLKNLKELGEGAFSYSSIKSVTLPDTITLLPKNVFDTCRLLEELNAPGVTELDSLCMFSCTSLESGFDWSKIKKLDPVSLIMINFADELVFFDSIEEIEAQGVSATSGGTMVFPTIKKLENQMFLCTSNLLWLPNAEEITLTDDQLNGLRVSDKLKKADILSKESAEYFIGPKDSFLREETDKLGIPYYPEQTLFTDQTKLTVTPQTDFSLYAAYVADPEMYLKWVAVTDDTEMDVPADAVSKSGTACDLNFSVFNGNLSEPGTYRYRAVLYGADGILESTDFTVTVAESVKTVSAEEMNYSLNDNAHGLADRVYRPGEDILFRNDIPEITVYSEENCKVRLRTVNRNVHLNGTISSVVFGTAESVSDERYAELHTGYNLLQFGTGINRDVFKMPLVFRIEKVQTELKQAEISPQDAEYTGKPIRPAFSVRMDDKLLEEGRDYLIEKDLTVTEAGKYRVTLTGCGDYYGEVICTFCVLPKEKDPLPALTEGTHTVQTSENPVMFTWTPEKEQYGLSYESLKNCVLTVYEPDGSVKASLHGIGYQAKLLTVTPGTAYKVAASNLYASESGEFTFTLKADCRLLSDAELEITKLVRFGNQPVYTLKENGKLLTEGTDYTVSCIGTQRHLGNAYLAFRGCGNYIGEIDGFYCIAPVDTETFPDTPNGKKPSLIMQREGVPLSITETKYPGTVQLYGYSIYYDYQYTLTVPAQEMFNVSVLVYVNDDAPILCKEAEIKLDLKEKDFVTVMIISDYLLYNVIEDVNRPYSICLNGSPDYHETVIDGIRYRIKNFEATVIGAETDSAALKIPSCILDPANGEPTIVKEIDPVAFAPYARTCTILTERGGTMEKYCEKKGYHYALYDSDFAVSGDVNGNGKLDYHDVILLQQYLTECDGIVFTEAQAEAADLDQDGSITVRDLSALMHQLTPPENQQALAELLQSREEAESNPFFF